MQCKSWCEDSVGLCSQTPLLSVELEPIPHFWNSPGGEYHFDGKVKINNNKFILQFCFNILGLTPIIRMAAKPR